MTLGVRAVRRGAGRAARPPPAAGVHLHLRASPRSCCCCCRCCRCIGTTINGARIWIHLGPFSFQPGEVAKVLLVIAFAGYLVLHRDALALAGRRFAVHRPAPRPRPRPDPGDVADQPRHPGLPARPRLVAAVLRPVPGDALRRHRAARLAGRRRVLFLGRRLRRLPGRSATCRPASTSGCTRSTPTTPTAPTRSSQGMFGMALGRPDRPRPRPGRPDADPVRLLRLHHRPRSARSSG